VTVISCRHPRKPHLNMLIVCVCVCVCARVRACVVTLLLPDD